MAETLAAQLRLRLLAALAKIPRELPDGFVPEVVSATNPAFGDYQSNAAMILAKQKQISPLQLAGEIVEKFDGGDLCVRPEIAGSGFINFRITQDTLAAAIRSMLADRDRLGVHESADPKTVVIDFSAPNVAKPMHVGHIRSTIIGDCLARVARFLGHRIITDNHLGDWGTQFGMILWGWKNVLNQEDLERDPIQELLRIYREVSARQKIDEGVRDACRAELVKLQGGDEHNLAIWKQCIDLSKKGLQESYDLLDVKFDYWHGESFYSDRLSSLVQDLIDKGIAEESEGAICVFLRDNEKLADKPCLIRKSDGGFLYATSDLATIDYRTEVLKADAAWYVIGAPQQLHFDQVFAIARKRGITMELVFIPVGSILGKDHKMLRTRSGETVQLHEVLREAIERAHVIIDEKSPELSANEKSIISQVIGIGAVKYSELSQFRMTDYVFDWDTMLSLKGNTAPYLINAYVRTRSIFRKLGSDFEGIGPFGFGEKTERTLALKLAQFGEIIPAVLNDFRPNILATYLYELAATFHSFYEACSVLESEGESRQARLALCELTGRVLRIGLNLLGIKTTERM